MLEFLIKYGSIIMWATIGFNLFEAFRSSRWLKKRIKEFDSLEDILKKDITRFNMMRNVMNRLATKEQIREINKEFAAIELLLHDKTPKKPELKLVNKGSAQ